MIKKQFVLQMQNYDSWSSPTGLKLGEDIDEFCRNSSIDMQECNSGTIYTFHSQENLDVFRLQFGERVELIDTNDHSSSQF